MEDVKQERTRAGALLDHVEWILRLLPVVAVIYYLAVRSVFTNFYNEFFVTPEMVGYGYFDIMVGSALAILGIAASVGLLLLLVTTLALLWPPAFSFFRRYVVVLGLLAILVLGTLSIFALRNRAEIQAEFVRDGGSVSTVSPVFFGVMAAPACVYWNELPEEHAVDTRVDGRELVYFGEAVGTTVLFDRLFYRTLLVPSGDITVSLGFTCVDPQ